MNISSCLLIGLCPRRNHTNPGSSKHSTVANLKEVKSLFDAVTATDSTIDPRIKWNVLRISREEEDINHFRKAPSSVDKFSGEYSVFHYDHKHAWCTA